MYTFKQYITFKLFIRVQNKKIIDYSYVICLISISLISLFYIKTFNNKLSIILACY